MGDLHFVVLVLPDEDLTGTKTFIKMGVIGKEEDGWEWQWTNVGGNVICVDNEMNDGN